MKTLLFIQPSLQPPGGGNGLAAWMLEALRRDYKLTVFTWQPFDVASINRGWGTSLRPDDIEALTVPAFVRALVDGLPLPLSLLKSSLLFRFARPLMPRYDLVVSANNEVDFGRPGIQYVHYPAYLRPRPRIDIRWYHHPRFVLAGYYWLCDRLFGVTPERLLDNITLVNSDWTGMRFRQRYGGATRTVYPPVTGRFRDVSWDERRNGFVCLGRIAPEKDLDSVIDIVAAVRRVHRDVHLHVIGSPGYRRYVRRILGRIAGHRDWITVHLDVSHDEVRRLITANRYGLHAMENEHFGMAPAEMVTGGCIVWVRDEGGQVEIVGGERRLMFRSTEDAVAKILRTMASAEEQASLRATLAARVPLFSVERFVEDMRAVAAEQLTRQLTSATDTIARNVG
jgi:glycosyltransferase involved in cell wall biosynthesis